MNIIAAKSSDAEEISELIIELSSPFYISSSREGAETFLASICPEAIRGYISANNFSYFIARLDGQLAGVVALRDNVHLFHLFVAEAFQGRGLATQLWRLVETNALQSGNQGEFTVNSSLNAVPVYERFGFVQEGSIQQINGILFQPMRISTRDNSI